MGYMDEYWNRTHPLTREGRTKALAPVLLCEQCQARVFGSVSGLCRSCVKSGARQLNSDAYVLSRMGLREAPQALIDAKREQLRLRQLIKQLHHQITEELKERGK